MNMCVESLFVINMFDVQCLYARLGLCDVCMFAGIL